MAGLHFSQHVSSTKQLKPYVIVIIGTLALLIGAEAQLGLLHLSNSEVLTDVERIVTIPGALTAIEVRDWPNENVTLATTFAVSSSGLTSARLDVIVYVGEPDFLFCSIGAATESDGQSTSLNNFYSGSGMPLSVFPLSWRAPCKPAKVPFRENRATCAVVLTATGDLQLLDVRENNILWRSNTMGVGRANLTLDDFYTLSLYTTVDQRTQWQSRVNETGGYAPECGVITVESLSESSLGFKSAGVSCFLSTFLTVTAFLLL